jgi:succinate dehydrogenase hydrophobic anchor subunit
MNISRIITILLTCAAIVFLVLILSDPYEALFNFTNQPLQNTLAFQPQ